MNKNKNFIEIIIPGEPIAQKRHRVSFQARRIYDPLGKIKKKFTLDDSIIRINGSTQFLESESLQMCFEFVCNRPKNHHRKNDVDNSIKPNFLHSDKVTKSDTDNYVKYYMDLLQNLEIKGYKIADDKKIIKIEALKRYYLNNENNYTYIKILPYITNYDYLKRF